MVSIPSLIRQSVADRGRRPTTPPFRAQLTNRGSARPRSPRVTKNPRVAHRHRPCSIRSIHGLEGACGARGRRRGSLSFGFEALSISLRSILGGDDNLLQSRPPTAPLGPSPTPPYPSKNPPPTPKRTRIHYLPPASLPRLTRKLPLHAATGGLTRVQGLALILTACSVN